MDITTQLSEKALVLLANLIAKGIIIDIEDAELIATVSQVWEILSDKTNVKAYCTVDTKIKYLHHVILPVAAGQMVDHINGDGWDNRKSNLRIVTNQQNCMNQRPRLGRKYKGVAKLPSGRYRTRITVEGAHLHVGVFDTEIEAAKAYNEMAVLQYGQYARLNKVD
jgi:hypothetical protein